jgi:hypothetical protein
LPAAPVHVVPEPDDLLAEDVGAVLELAVSPMSGRERGEAVLQHGEVVRKPLHVVIAGVGRGLERGRGGRGDRGRHDQRDE